MIRNDNEAEQPITRFGKIRYGLAALILGLPLPFVILAFLMPGCGGGSR